MVGYDPLVIAFDRLGSELEVLRSVGEGLSDGIQANNLRLDAIGRMLRMAGWLLILAPAIGAIAYREAPMITVWFAAALQLFLAEIDAAVAEHTANLADENRLRRETLALLEVEKLSLQVQLAAVTGKVG